jgi:hypothetical protein
MGYFLPEHRHAVKYGSSLAERVVHRSLGWRTGDVYDVLTASELKEASGKKDAFAQLYRVDPESSRHGHFYRVCLLDEKILSFLDENPSLDLVSLITFIMTHELLHIHRFSTGKADFFGDTPEEEAVVDAMTRVILAKHPVIGLKRVLSLLDSMEAVPLYNRHILNETRCVHAYL